MLLSAEVGSALLGKESMTVWSSNQKKALISLAAVLFVFWLDTLISWGDGVVVLAFVNGAMWIYRHCE